MEALNLVKLYYPKKTTFTAQTTLGFLSEPVSFPRFSITVFDDIDFRYERQYNGDKQIISTTISDDAFPYSSDKNKTNYLNGISGNNQNMYFKILVANNITQDSIGSISSYFVLSITTFFSQALVRYYPITCIDKNDQYTVYRASVVFINSDYKMNSDGEFFMNLLGDFSVSINTPITLTATNASFTPININYSGNQNLIPSSANNTTYFSIQNKDFSVSYSASYASYSFTSVNYSSGILFNTVSSIINFGDSGTLIKIEFQSTVLSTSLQYFGLTFKNSNISFNPKNLLLAVIIRGKSGTFYRIENNNIFYNAVSGYYNVVFKLNNVLFLEDYIDYVMLEITPTVSYSSTYTLTFFSFLNKASANFTVFSDAHTYDSFNKKIDLFSLSNSEIINSENYITANSILSIADNNYYITSEKNSGIFASGFFFLSENNYIIAEDLLPGDTVETINGTEKIFSIEKTCEISHFLDIESNYILSGFRVKNPIYIKEHSTTSLHKKEISRKKITLDHTDFEIDYDGTNYQLSDLILSGGKLHNFNFQSLLDNDIFILLECASNTFVNTEDEKHKIISGTHKIFINQNSFTIRSNDNITIKKLVAR